MASGMQDKISSKKSTAPDSAARVTIAVTVARSEKRKRLEIMVGAALVFLVVASGIAGWVTDGRIFRPIVQFLQFFEPRAQQSRNKAVSCKDPSNSNTPYCQDHAGTKDSNWRSTSKGWGDSGSAFGLGGN